ncbi:uncharacterized protein LOC115921359 [Strongylocentrotus purpuratus]|uniref:Uncharacterized protein n=1 Tax=Strongylocentrotus purpuratus TaxID=7668 RepID=A0A7M7ND49_STRPU|nr:uncharacterized protein LOC115921359 [Strongylocentrotus purpuratus]
MTKLEQSMDIFMRDFREMDAESERRHRAEQRRTTQELFAFEEQQTQIEIEARREEAEKTRVASRENTQMLADTLRQVIQPNQPTFNQIATPQQYQQPPIYFISDDLRLVTWEAMLTIEYRL